MRREKSHNVYPFPFGTSPARGRNVERVICSPVRGAVRANASVLVRLRGVGVCKKVLLLLLPIIFFTSCEKGFEDLNKNPNEPDVINIDHLFTQSVLVGSGQYNTGVTTEIWTLMEWTQQTANRKGIVSSTQPYTYGGSWNDDLWYEWYSKALMPAQKIIELTESDELNSNKYHIARIWKAFLFHRITDLWGDVPYFDALKGAAGYGELDLTPKYDKQEDIYKDLIKELNEATSKLDDAQTTFSSSDPIYNGDIDKWRRFANSLQLRLLNRIKNVEPSYTNSRINSLIQKDEFISSSNENAAFAFNGNVRNPMYELYDNGQGMSNPSHFLVEMLKNSNDPRLSKMVTSAPAGNIGFEEFQGIPNLKTAEELGDDYGEFYTSEIAESYRVQDSKRILFSYAEVCFLKAEINSSEEDYNNGVQAHMEFLDVDNEEINLYLENDGKYDGSDEQIINQKYIALSFIDGYESYAELRRTGFPVLKTLENETINWSEFPKRFPYPNAEISLNGENVKAVGSGINDMLTKLWWDIR